MTLSSTGFLHTFYMSESSWQTMTNPIKPALEVIIEAIVLSANEPVSMRTLREAVGGGVDTLAIQEAIERLTHAWQDRGLELMLLADGYRFRTKPNLQIYIERAQSARAPRYSKSVMETLAVIVYRQPVTRADIENIRGVAVNSNAIKILEARGWIESLGVKKDSPGQPTLWGTTRQFLNDLGLKSLSQLPPLEEIAQTLESVQESLPLEARPMEKSATEEWADRNTISPTAKDAQEEPVSDSR